MSKENPDQANQAGQESEQGELSGMRDYIEKFQRDQEADRAAEKKKVASREKTPEESEKKETPNEEVQEASTEKPQETETKPQYLINEENPLIIKVDGKEIPVTDIEKLKTYAQLGYHGNVRLEDLKKQEEALKEKEAFLEKSTGQLLEIQKAIKEGRLVIKTGEGSKENLSREEGEELDDSVYEDPEYQKLAKKNTELEKKVNAFQELVMGMVFNDAKTDLESKIAAAKKNYPNADDDEVWRLLAKKDEKTGEVVFKNVEDAVKHSHERIGDLVNKHIETNTDLKKVTPELKDLIINDYLALQEELNKPPVGAPSTTSSAVNTGKEKKDFKSFADAMTAFSEDHADALRLGKKS